MSCRELFYSPLCDVDVRAYIAYLVAVFEHGTSTVEFGGVDGGRSIEGCNGRFSGFGDRFANAFHVAESCFGARAVGVVGSGGNGSDNDGSINLCVGTSDGPAFGSGGVSSGDVGSCGSSVCGSGSDVDVQVENGGDVDTQNRDGKKECVSDESLGSLRLGPNGGRSFGRGKNYERNEIARARKRLAKKQKGFSGAEKVAGVQSPSWRVRSDVTSEGMHGDDAVKRELRLSYDRRRVKENELAARKADLALQRLGDESYVAAHSDMCKKRVIARTNSAVEQSEKSLSGIDSISPGSSSSQHDIRMQAKELEDVKYKFAKLCSSVTRCLDGDKRQEVLSVLDEIGSATAEEYRAEYEMHPSEYEIDYTGFENVGKLMPVK